MTCLAALVLTADQFGAAVIGLSFSNIIQMLVFYTWVVRFMAETISLFASVEGIAFLATYVPPDGVFYDHKRQNGTADTIIAPDGEIVPGE